jgi:hypothetical protein
MGTLAHWSQPGGETSSSSGISTTTAPGPPAAAGTGEVGGVATATAAVAPIVDAAGCSSTSAAGGCDSTSLVGCYGSTSVADRCGSATTAARCASAAAGNGTVIATGCGSVASAVLCEPPLAADTALVAARDALDERRLVGTTASILSTLQAREEARWAPPCEHEDKKLRPWPVQERA